MIYTYIKTYDSDSPFCVVANRMTHVPFIDSKVDVILPS